MRNDPSHRLRCAQLDEVLRDAKRYKPSELALVCGDFNLDASNGAAADVLNRADFEDALANRHAPTKPHSFFEQGKIIDWIFARVTDASGVESATLSIRFFSIRFLGSIPIARSRNLQLKFI